jgi:hypothetical protein
MSRKIDPAAMLIAILTVAISPLTTVGPWDKMNTIIAVVVGVVLLAFTWPSKAKLQDESGHIAPVDKWVPAALAITYGLVITIGSAWIVQLILNPPDCPEHAADQLPQACVNADDVAGRATNWALGIGLVAAIILFFILRNGINRLTDQPAKVTH